MKFYGNFRKTRSHEDEGKKWNDKLTALECTRLYKAAQCNKGLSYKAWYLREFKKEWNGTTPLFFAAMYTAPRDVQRSLLCELMKANDVQLQPCATRDAAWRASLERSMCDIEASEVLT